MFETVWSIGFLLFIVVATAIVINLYEEFNSIKDELEGRKDENKNNRFIK